MNTHEHIFQSRNVHTVKRSWNYFMFWGNTKQYIFLLMNSSSQVHEQFNLYFDEFVMRTHEHIFQSSSFINYFMFWGNTKQYLFYSWTVHHKFMNNFAICQWYQIFIVFMNVIIMYSWTKKITLQECIKNCSWTFLNCSCCS